MAIVFSVPLDQVPLSRLRCHLEQMRTARTEAAITLLTTPDSDPDKYLRAQVYRGIEQAFNDISAEIDRRLKLN